MGEYPAVGVEAAKLDVGELLLPDAIVPCELEEIEPRFPVVLRNRNVIMEVEDVLLEVEPGRSSLLADSASPATL